MSEAELTREEASGTQPPVLTTVPVSRSNGLEDSNEEEPNSKEETPTIPPTVPGLTEMLNEWEIRGVPEEKTFFSSNRNLMEAAIRAIKARLDEQDGNIRKFWLLSEIDHWDLEKERILVLTDNNIISIKYNFIQQMVDELKYIPLAYIKEIQVGKFNYTYSYAHVRDTTGMKIIWGDTNIGFFDKWNPFSTKVPFTTFTSHVLAIRKKLDDPKLKLDGVPEEIEKAINDLRVRSAEAQAASSNQPMVTPPEFKIKHEDIIVDYYLGVSALVHNQSSLGFFKKRGAINW